MNKKGFTLIEFIIVMAIIGILVLMAAPKFMDYINDAKISQVQNDMRVIQSVVMADQADAITNDKPAKFVAEGTFEVQKGDKWYPVSLDEAIEPGSELHTMQKDDDGNPKFAEHVNTKLKITTDEGEDTIYEFAANANGEIFVNAKNEPLSKILERRDGKKSKDTTGE